MQTTALVLAAGLGTRMKSDMPKVAFGMFNKPLVRWVVDAARSAGCDDVITVLGHKSEIVEPIVFDTEVVLQKERLGTGHAVMMAADALEKRGGKVVVLSGDCPLVTSETIEKLARSLEEENASCVVLTFIPDNPHGYGRVIRNQNGDVVKIVEQKDCTADEASVGECNSGMYCFRVDDLLYYLSKLGNDNAQGEYYLTDVVGMIVADGKKVCAIAASDPNEALGINNRVQLAQATKVMQHRINEKLMLDGVTMLDPDLVWIGPDVVIENDVEILPLTMIIGESKVCSGSTIGPNTRIVDSTIGRDCTVEESVVLESVLDDRVACGPRAYLRPGVHMCEGSKAGTHVELKKSTVGKGSKVPHLSYIGDTTIGEGVNIGAGSITCNYDGEKKNPTTIGDRSFIGSDTMMVAPVNIGNDVLVGAGSTITMDVPDGALSIARSRQRNIEGYHDRKMRKQGENDNGDNGN
ncbi:MAG: bifunctional UDP-N-acetylglucosamine diphosphorylase/glucosamine-1-phosphate N-acetyltransferase GlmU [Coriobacteriales bacterium]|jgi:bifunctional UDP-N-acetylglucosamine pyrophosphorylase/glucosamine-1-phosphate N-acetyltransferase